MHVGDLDALERRQKQAMEMARKLAARTVPHHHKPEDTTHLHLGLLDLAAPNSVAEGGWTVRLAWWVGVKLCQHANRIGEDQRARRRTP
jgi:hypothetical protein